jgi:hypothetical protein
LRQVTFVTFVTKFPPARIPRQKDAVAKRSNPGGSVRRLVCILVKIPRIANSPICAKARLWRRGRPDASACGHPSNREDACLRVIQASPHHPASRFGNGITCRSPRFGGSISIERSRRERAEGNCENIETRSFFVPSPRLMIPGKNCKLGSPWRWSGKTQPVPLSPGILARIMKVY